MLGVPAHVTAGAALVVASIPLLGWSLAGTRRSRPDPAALVSSERQGILKESAVDRAVMPVVRAVGRQARRLTPAGWVDRIDRLLRLAGSPNAWTVERVLAVKLGFGGATAVAALSWVSADPTPSALAGALAAGFTVYLLPDLVLWGRGRERQQLIRKELPDTLDQLTISVEAGLGFDAALHRVAASGSGPLAEELQRTLNEVTVGHTRAEALRHLTDRTNVPELRHFVLALTQAEQYGLPIARVLRIQSAELRVKRRQRAEEEALKIPVKIVFPLVFCIFPALFVVLLGPAVVRVIRALM